MFTVSRVSGLQIIIGIAAVGVLFGGIIAGYYVVQPNTSGGEGQLVATALPDTPESVTVTRYEATTLDENEHLQQIIEQAHQAAAGKTPAAGEVVLVEIHRDVPEPAVDAVEKQLSTYPRTYPAPEGYPAGFYFSYQEQIVVIEFTILT